MTKGETSVKGNGDRILDLHVAMEKLAQIRDEQRVRLHLAKADARDEWAKVEARWDQLQGRVQKLQDAAADAGEDVWSGVEVLLDEVKQGYEKIRRAL